ncbi:MAG TPA: hypothetical protein DCS71_04225 [Flavobacteriales bacterium]|nr:hypothetical protein [Flavobacteriales bacterium]
MENLPLAPLDVLLLFVVLVGAWRGFSKGLILSLASVVGLVVGIWAASYFSHLVAEQMAPHLSWSTNSIHMLSLALTFLLVVIVVRLLAKILEKILDFVALGFVNKSAGALFGLLKYALVLSFVMMLLNRWDGSRSWLPASNQPTLLLDHIESLAPALIPTLNDLEHRVLESGLPPDSAEDP